MWAFICVCSSGDMCAYLTGYLCTISMPIRLWMASGCEERLNWDVVWALYMLLHGPIRYRLCHVLIQIKDYCPKWWSYRYLLPWVFRFWLFLMTAVSNWADANAPWTKQMSNENLDKFSKFPLTQIYKIPQKSNICKTAAIQFLFTQKVRRAVVWGAE